MKPLFLVRFEFSRSYARIHLFIHSHSLTHTHTKKNTSNFKMLEISAAVAPILFLCIREFHALNYLPVSCSIPTMQTHTDTNKNGMEKIKRAGKSGLSVAMMTLLLPPPPLLLFKRWLCEHHSGITIALDCFKIFYVLWAHPASFIPFIFPQWSSKPFIVVITQRGTHAPTR